MNALSKFGQRLSKARACIHRCLRSKRIVLSSLAALAATLLILPQPAAAIFGFGDIVFDPTSYATLGKILVSDASTLTKITAEIAQLKAIYSNGMQMYNQALAMAQTVNGLRRLNWLTVGIHFVKDQTQNQFGETVNWAALLNGNPALVCRPS